MAATGSAVGAVAVTKSDTVNIPRKATRGLYVGVGGDVVVVFENGDAVTFKDVPAGEILPVEAVRVNSTNTTATDILALY